tara:strand:+ start:1959 stop:3104 length:1146 start_codon:yes stop_codon:yes gene_type:complete
MARYQWRPDLDEHEVIPGTENEPMRVGEKLLLAPELNLGPSKIVGNPEVSPKVSPKIKASKVSDEQRKIMNLQKQLEYKNQENTVLRKYGKPDKKFLEDLEEVKFEEGIGLVGQTSGKKYDDMKLAVKMNDHYDLASPEGKRTLKQIQKLAYQYGTNEAVQPHWLKKEEQQQKKLEAFVKSEDPVPRGLGNKNLTSTDPRTPVQKKRDQFKAKQGGMAKTVKTNFGNVKIIKEKSPDTWTAMKQTATSPEDIKGIRDTVQSHVKSLGTKYLEPDEFKYLRVNGVIPGEEPKAKPEVFQDTQLLNDIEQMAQHRMESQILENKFHDIMKPQRDPDADKGIASVEGVEDFKQVVDLADQKFPKTRTGYEGIGPNLTGLPDKVI